VPSEGEHAVVMQRLISVLLISDTDAIFFGPLLCLPTLDSPRTRNLFSWL